MVIHVAAAGNGTRMQTALEEMGFEGLPKHLLPTGEYHEQSLVGRNIAAALETSHEVILHANENNYPLLAAGIGHLAIPIITDTLGSPLGPFSFTDHIAAGHTGASVAGDVFIEHPNWTDFLTAHEASRYPVSFLVGRVSGYPTNAAFDVNKSDGKIERFYRLTDEEHDIYRNIGMYAFTKTAEVVDVLEFYADRSAGEEDKVATDLIREGLVRAHIHPDRFFNINCRTDYESLLNFTATLQASSPE